MEPAARVSECGDCYARACLLETIWFDLIIANQVCTRLLKSGIIKIREDACPYARLRSGLNSSPQNAKTAEMGPTVFFALRRRKDRRARTRRIGSLVENKNSLSSFDFLLATDSRTLKGSHPSAFTRCQKRWQKPSFLTLAEAEGFEPSRGFLP